LLEAANVYLRRALTRTNDSDCILREGVRQTGFTGCGIGGGRRGRAEFKTMQEIFKYMPMTPAFFARDDEITFVGPYVICGGITSTLHRKRIFRETGSTLVAAGLNPSEFLANPNMSVAVTICC